MALEDANDTVRRHDYHRIENEITIQPDRLFGVRHFHVLLFFFGLACSYAMQACLLPALVAIIDSKSYDWDEKSKGYVLSSFYWGYILTQIPAGQFAEKYGAKPILLWSTVSSIVTVLLMPLGIWNGGWQLLCVLRMMLGMFQGFINPSIYTLLAKWSPVSERAQMVTCSYSGMGFGMMAIFSGSGLLVEAVGWPSIFYACGLATGLWSILWLCFGSSSPADCKYISANELQYIHTSLERHTGQCSGGVQGLRTPWKDILTSRAFYALLIVGTTSHWGNNTLGSYIPSYLDGVLKFNMKANGLLSALPQLMNLIMNYFFCFLSGFLERNNCVSLEYNRKMFSTIGQWIPAIALIMLGYLPENNTTLAVFFLVFAVAMTAAINSGFLINAIDIAPNFAGTLTGISIATSNIVFIFAPIFVGMVLKDDSDVIGWRVVFFTSAAIYFTGNLIFILFGSTKTQKWNSPGNLNEN